MREIEINISDVRSKELLHERIKDALGFPDYYGGNLDALYDCLTDISEPLEIVFLGAGECKHSSLEMEDYFERLEYVLNDASSECENLTFILLKEGGDEENVMNRGMAGDETMDTIRFRDLNKQYEVLKDDLDEAIKSVLEGGIFIGGDPVKKLEGELAEYVGAKHCITCANGTDALTIALMAWGIGPGDAVFVPDFTFFASGEAVAICGAKPIFVDVSADTFNMEARSLYSAVEKVKEEGKYRPRAVIAVDLFGLPANMTVIKDICAEQELLLLEDAAQGFGGAIGEKMSCSFGDIAITSFFPAKPLGCYGDGGAIFTDNDEWADLIRSICVHGKGDDKYDNIRIGMNSRLDTIQAAILRVKLKAFIESELEAVNRVAEAYRMAFRLRFGPGSTRLWLPKVPEGYKSSYAQFTVRFADEEKRDGVKAYLEEKGIPTTVYYPKPMHSQTAFGDETEYFMEFPVTNKLCKTVLSLPMHPYIEAKDIAATVDAIWEYFGKPEPQEDLNPFSHLHGGKTEHGIR